MKHHLRRNGTTTAIAAMALSALFVPSAMACGNPAQRLAAGALSFLTMPRIVEPDLPALPSESQQGTPEHSMTGLWKTTLVSGGSVVMVAFDTWHSDGTELALDGLFPPATGNVCPGVWEKTAPRTYSTVHPAFEYDNAGVNIVAIFIERMHVTISADGSSFQGTFTWDNYDFKGKLLAGSVAGTVTGARVKVGSAFPFPFPL